MTVRKLSEGNFRLANYVNNEWSIVPDDGTAFDDLLVPVYWTNVARKLKPGDKIKVHAPDASYYAELYVRSSERLAASVVVLVKMDFAGADAAESPRDEMFVKFRNHKAMWAVLRMADKSVVRDGFATREMAEEWLRDRNRAQAA